ncbi:unnamed protein product [Moneuplotes crassus]|uniref:Uncharacterized protein n=1 Tax=Euplotes crassus TaxID=5936 RepID=A0AAD1U414_EUPCR|nr:unnamed protein product [Moneuplotes crassus]
MKNGCTEPRKFRDDDSGDDKQPENTRVTINKFQPTLSYASTEITPPKGEIETIEVIDEWALIYCNDDMPVTRNTVGGYSANFHPSRTAIREEKKVEELSDSESKKFENPPAPGKKSSSGLCSSKGIKFSFKENLDNQRNAPAMKELLKPKFAPRLQPQKPFLPRKPKCKKMKPIDIKNSKLTNTLPKRSLKASSSIIKLSYHKPRKGISSKNQVNRQV